ncbi:MAG: endopeptidase La [Oscillospiraceae bacterium]|jgi:ATP-dependent Lon protease|nr:endopeptidase La [Oscillospiraceae bacterium]
MSDKNYDETAAEQNFPPEPKYEKLPLLALRGLCAFPGMLLNFDVERDISTAALDAAGEYGRRVFLIAQRDIMKESPRPDDLYKIGTICQIKQLLKIPGGGVKALVEGVSRARLHEAALEHGYYIAEAEEIPEPESPKKTARLEGMMRRCAGMFDTYSMMSSGLSRETVFPLFGMTEPGKIADYIAQHMFLRHDVKQPILETIKPAKRLELVCDILAHELEVQGIEHEIEENLRMRLEGQQRDHILREQLHAIQSELGEEREPDNEVAEYRRRIAKLKVPEEVSAKLFKETDKLEKQHYGSAEASVITSYLDLCLELPWNKETAERRDIAAARRALDNDHFGLDKVKERIIEFLAVKQLKPDHKGTIICLLGPPGVGKTSVAISVARALNRKLARLSLGGIHDEAEIRGHRKTYVGAMPGRIIEAVNRAGTRNPLMLLDEIDKLGSDYRGDPAAALLEALDPEQNSSFRDHYLELPFDLSDTMFITTANSASTIPRPLLDRMEIIEMSSYTDVEKLEIAKRHLISKQRKKHGLTTRQLKFSDSALLEIIAGWTRESGVRQLERDIATVCRKTAAKVAGGEAKSVSVTPENLPELLGARIYTPEAFAQADEVGVAHGLAWTSAGGTTLDVEVNVLPGKGVLKLTGNLGDTMKESAEAAVSYIRSRAERLHIPPDFYKEKDLHIHFPEGGVPKDGPSAGITMAIAVISALTGAPVRRGVTMTGEITLRGRILRIGGLREKTMAALRAGATTVIIPADNEPDLEEIDQTVRRALNFVTARSIDTVLDVALDFSAVAPAEASAEPPKADVTPVRGAPKNPPRVRQ